jgi:hypothetical protein
MSLAAPLHLRLAVEVASEDGRSCPMDYLCLEESCHVEVAVAIQSRLCRLVVESQTIPMEVVAWQHCNRTKRLAAPSGACCCKPKHYS